MVLKSDIEAAYRSQQARTIPKGTFTERLYTKELKHSGKHIEVTSGIRRCGKSTLMKQFMSRYRGAPAFFNFEDSRIYGFDAGDFQKMNLLAAELRGIFHALKTA